ENKRIRQQHESLQEENRETLRINSELKEALQEKENRETLRINSELKVKLQERDEQLEKLQQQDLNFEKQKIEIQVISQNIEKTLEMLESDEINENNNKILKEKNKPLISESMIHTNYDWPGSFGELKTNTVLQYDDEYINVMSWGAPALFKRPPFKKKIGKDNETKPVELFKLHLSNLPDELKPKLPVRYEKAITDYLREIGKVIKETIASRWIGIDILHQVLLVLTYPADYSDKAKAIMRKCAFNPGIKKEFQHRINISIPTQPTVAVAHGAVKTQFYFSSDS
ncbi:16602_t:CDS:2, partial [Funneliformis caledonium]